MYDFESKLFFAVVDENTRSAFAGAEEIGTSDISIVAHQVVRDMGWEVAKDDMVTWCEIRSYIRDVINEMTLQGEFN